MSTTENDLLQPEESLAQRTEMGLKSTKTAKKIFRVLSFFALMGALCLVYWFFFVRGLEYTDDAYVAGHQVAVNAQSSGTVSAVFVDDTQRVKAGQLIARLDDTDAQLLFIKAQADLAQAVRNTNQLTVSLSRHQAQLNLRKIELNRAQEDYQRRLMAQKMGAISEEEVQHAKQTLAATRAALDVAGQDLKITESGVLSHDVMKNPAVLRAMLTLQEAYLNLKRTEIIAPVDGQVAKRSVQLGARVNPGTPVVTLIQLNSLWVDANFKETQLANLRLGQKVELTADMYGSDVVYHGKVLGISAGSGSAFSLLQAQNATGNWVKVVQRFPVRIGLDEKELATSPLRIGLSMHTTVDVSDVSGGSLAEVGKLSAPQETTLYKHGTEELGRLINEIVAANLGKKSTPVTPKLKAKS
ncbi:MAG: HlyD family efflux transporter periplasmic adaptor subunit [Neisseriaceae bacterium]|nr:HlyD family efflux transporter periplasmic adaptor subunit [Neisseriaceae bacterium]